MYRVLAAVAASALSLTALGPSPGASPVPSPSRSPEGSGPSTTPVPQVGLAWERVADTDLVSYPRNGSMHGVVSGGPGAVAWGYVYLTGPRIWTSSDGRDWVPATVEAPTDAAAEYPGEVIDVAAGDESFVAVGSYLPVRSDPRALVWTSSDGLTWALIPDASPFDRAEVHRVVAWAGGFLAFGNDYVAMDEAGPQRMWSSADGSTWTDVVPVLPEGVERVSSVVPASDRLWGIVSSGPDGLQRVTSLDGRTWSLSPLPVVGPVDTTYALPATTYGEALHPLADGLYLTVTAMAKEAGPARTQQLGIQRSTDDVSWTPLAVGRRLGSEVMLVDDTLVMVGRRGRCIGFADRCLAAGWRSTDGGSTWQRVPVTGTPAWASRGWMTSAAALPDGTLVAVGTELAGGEPSTAAWVSAVGSSGAGASDTGTGAGHEGISTIARAAP